MTDKERENERQIVLDLAQHWPPVQFRAVMFWMGRAHGAEIRADEAEEEALEQARLNGMGSEREASLIGQLEVMTREARKWKANHDNQAELHRAIKDRPDLGDRCRSVLALISERDRLKDALHYAELEAAVSGTETGQYWKGHDEGCAGIAMRWREALTKPFPTPGVMSDPYETLYRDTEALRAKVVRLQAVIDEIEAEK